MKRYEVIFFDLDHTLVDTRGQYDLGLKQTIQDMYQGDVPDDFQTHFMTHHRELWKEYDRRTITMVELRRERFLRAWRDFGEEKSVSEADQFHEVYMASFDSTLLVYEGTLQMVDALSRHHRLGIITNGSPDLQERKLRSTGLLPYFAPDAMIISEKIGLAKPHPSVYEAAFRALSVHPGQALMVGDNFEADVRGARACGLDAIWYVPDEGFTRENDFDGHHRAIETPEALLVQIEKMEQAR